MDVIKIAILAFATLAANCVMAASKASVPEPENVPQLLRTFNGKDVKTVAQWESKRAPELFNEFMKMEYGKRPVERPKDLSFSLEEPDKEMMGGKAIRKRVRVSYSGKHGKGSFVLTAFIPKQEKPAPAFVLICNRNPKENIDPTRAKKSPFWPAEQIVSRGYAAITFWNGDVAPDADYGNRKGVFACFEEPNAVRRNDAWGTLSAWAWGASRVMDWIETESLLDAKHVGVVGHSRGGKTALLAGVTDKRLAMTCSNCSGCSGAKLNHIDLPKSEHLSQIVSTFNYWFCRNYVKLVNAETKWSMDQHEFIALIAPRLVCVASATEDHWAGQRGEWWAAKLASPAWELYGKKGLVGGAMPGADAPQQEGCISYHMRTGEHNLTPYDWDRYMDFADRHGWRK